MTQHGSTPKRSLDDVCPSRRSLLLTLGGLTLVPGVLTACSSADSAGNAGSAAAGSGGGKIAASQVGVGKAVVVNAAGGPVVLAQPTAGSYVAFSAVCTHQGSTVESGSGLVLTCPAHGSQFNAGEQGKAVRGPAVEPLPSLHVSLEGGDLVFS